MDKYNYLAKLQHEMENGNDSKLEAQLLLALESGLSAEDFLVACDGFFFREYSRDLLNTIIAEDARKRSILELHLARTGIYDQLPEGLFYQPGKFKSASANAGDMAEAYKLNKKKEQVIRRFFMPLDNDFFWQRVQLEKEECALLQGLQSGILNEYFTRLWNIDASIPKSLIIQLILLLPYAHRIAGDLSLTAQCLQKLLREPVNIEKVPGSVTHTDPDQIIVLGEQRLGNDMLCGTEFYDPYPVLEVSIGPLQRSSVSDYLEGGKKNAFLETFYRFFIPVEADIITTITVADAKRNMHLATTKDEQPVLGYSSYL